MVDTADSALLVSFNLQQSFGGAVMTVSVEDQNARWV